MINKISSADFGTYTATAINSVGRSSTSCCITEIRNIDIRPPSFQQGICNSTTNEGRTVELEVKIEPDESVTIKWEKDGCEINFAMHPRIELSRTSENSSRLTIRNCVKSDEGLYRCVANNRYGHVQTSAFVWVNESSSRRTENDEISNARPPIGTIETRKLSFGRDSVTERQRQQDEEECLEIVDSSPTSMEVMEGDEIVLWCKVATDSRIIGLI